MAEERLQKVLAQAGLGSRRACEELIQAGRVTVDGRVVTELGGRVDPALADIRVDGQPIAAEHHRYIMLHKPAGYLSGPDPRAGYPSWEELVKVPERLYAVGRLDQDSEGLLLLTNDGDLAVRLTHPRYEHAKDLSGSSAGLSQPAQDPAVAARRHAGGRSDAAGACGAVARAAPRRGTGGSRDGEAAER